jgi:acyl carrier protein
MTHLERIVADAWCAELGLDDVDLNANFFALGGHSLLIVRVLALIQERTSVEFSIRQFFEDPTVRGVAAALSQAQIEAAGPDVVEELLRQVQAAAAEPPPPPAERTGQPPAVRATGEIHTIAIPTCDRVAALSRGLGSYLANARRHGRSRHGQLGRAVHAAVVSRDARRAVQDGEG